MEINKSTMKKILYSYCLIILLITISCNSKKEETETISQKPNILLLVADDMGLSDIGPFGSEIQTPALNKLAEQSVLLSNFHCYQPVPLRDRFCYREQIIILPALALWKK